MPGGACKLLICGYYLDARHPTASGGKVAAAGKAAGHASTTGELTTQQMDDLADAADDLLAIPSPTKQDFDAYIAAVEAELLP